MQSDLIFLDRILGTFDRWLKPVYRIVGPSADREYLYCESDRRVRICFDYLCGADVDKVIYVSEINNWEPPHDHETISPEKRSEIVRRLEDTLKAQRARYELQ
ncbi:MAG: hypothetical protein H8F28_09505 [Fibrella sp.]|nr:hypothetical protein [Armatimonadota bacterium]